MSPGNRRCRARLKSNRADHCMKWAVPGESRCHLHGGLSTGPHIFFDPVSMAKRAARTAKMIEGRRIWLAMLKAEGRKAPCGRKPKDYRPLFATPKALLDQKARKADAKARLYPRRKEAFLAEQERRRREQAAAELKRIDEINQARQSRPQGDAEWARALREATQRHLAEQAYCGAALSV
jgi:hypothetical protein